MSLLTLRKERVSRSFVGYKLAYPMLSPDGARTGFAGVLLGRSQVYGTVADASCVQAPRHRPPNRFCDCGFYCLHSPEAARALACDPQYHVTVLLEVGASGRYIRYEEGLRYGHQRVRRVHVGRCRCGRPADVLIRAGDSQVGWYRLAGSCVACAGSAHRLSLGAFARLAGGDPPVVRDEAPSVLSPASGGGEDTVSVLAAEAALLQARLDQLQERLSRLAPPAGDEGGDGDGSAGGQGGGPRPRR